MDKHEELIRVKLAKLLFKRRRNALKYFLLLTEDLTIYQYHDLVRLLAYDKYPEMNFREEWARIFRSSLKEAAKQIEKEPVVP